MQRLVRGVKEFWFEPSQPTNLGLGRLLFFGSLLVYYWGLDTSGWAIVPRVFWSPMHLFDALHLPVFSADALRGLDLAWKLALAMSCIGLFTRTSTAAACVIGLYLLGLPHNFGKVHHVDTIIVLTMVVLAFSRCGDAWSLDRVLRVARADTDVAEERDRASPEYTWPVRLIWVLFSLVFFGAGVSKLRRSGLEWVFSDHMAKLLVWHQHTHQPLTSLGATLARYGSITKSLAAGALTLEVAAPLALIGMRFRAVLIPGLLLMQLGILVLLGVSFVQYAAVYLFWIPYDHIGAWLAERSGRRPRFVVLYDGGCGFCKRAVNLIRAWDILGRIEYLDVLGNWRGIEERFPSLTRAACLETMHIVSPAGEVLTGFDGYRDLSRALPLWWPLIPFLYVPGIPAVGRRVYSATAAHRLRAGCIVRELD